MSGDSALGKLKLGVSPNPAARTSATLGIAVIAAPRYPSLTLTTHPCTTSRPRMRGRTRGRTTAGLVSAAAAVMGVGSPKRGTSFGSAACSGT